MHKSVEEMLPGFVFPQEFAESLPVGYEPIEPTPSVDDACRRVLLTIQGGLADYMSGEMAEIIHAGRLRDFRQYRDGTKLVRFDTPTKGSDNTTFAYVQFLLHLSEQDRVLAYSLLYEDLRATKVWRIPQSGKAYPTSSPDEVLSLVRRHPCDTEFLLCPSSIHHRGLRIIPVETDGVRAYHIRFYVEHLPWTFQLTEVPDERMESLVRGCIANGMQWLMNAEDWEYWDAGTGLGRMTGMGVYVRLVFQRHRAEFLGNDAGIALLDRLDVQDVETPSLWLPRLDASWPECLLHLVRIARGPEALRLDNMGRPLKPLDCDRVVAYAALEGCEEARADIATKFGIVL